MKLLLLLMLAASSGFAADLKTQLRKLAVRELPAQAKVEVESVYTRFRVPARARISLLNPRPPIGVISFEARWDEEGHPRKVHGSAVVRVVVPVAVARMPIRLHETFSEENVDFEPRELSPFVGSGYFLDWGKISTLRANGSLRPGTVLGLSNTSLAPMVYAGQAVDLIHQQGSLKLVARVKALESGEKKKWIRVENPSTKKVLMARVVGPAEVRLR